MPTKWPLPELDSVVPFDAIKLEHPTYTARRPFWEFFRHSDELTGGYAASVQTYTGPQAVPAFKETYLIPHLKESDPNDFARRVAASRPPRFVREGIESIVGVLTSQEPNRDNYPEKLQDWTSSVTIDGATLQQWISGTMWPLVERYGVCYSLARRPSIAAANLAEQEQALKDAGLPEVLLHVITPENLPWWATDDIGQFEIVRYTENKTDITLNQGYATLQEPFIRHWWITHEGWWYCDETTTTKKDGLKVEAVGTWDTKPLKHFPIVRWALKNERPPTEPASFAQLAYFRKESELHVVEVGAAFPMTWVPTTAGDEDPEETVKGVDQVAGWDPEGTGGARPMILETTGVSLTHFVDKRLPELEIAALAPYGRSKMTGGNDSGVALAHIQQTAINIYRQHSRFGGESEFAALQPVAELLGVELTDDDRCSWPRNFGTLSDSSQAEILKTFWDTDPGDGFKKEILKKFAQMIGDMTAAQLEEATEDWQSAKDEAKAKEEERLDAFMDTPPGADGSESRRQGAPGKPPKPFAANPKSALGPKKAR